MSAKLELIGRRFGRLKVVAEAGRTKWGNYRWRAKCLCGGGVVVPGGHLTGGHTTSCGCYQREATSRAKWKHGEERKGKRTTEYRTWLAMRERCMNPNNHAYHNYGGRGITVCPRWADSYAAFLLDMGRRPSGLSLDRTDVNGNYEPGNCRWVTAKEQRRNQRPRAK